MEGGGGEPGTAYPFPPGGPTAADRLVRGAIDLHHHGYPEFGFDVLTRLEDADELKNARAAGMRGIVLKSHMFPTVGRAYHLKRLVEGIEVHPSITLNPVAGGFNPFAIESAARQGARMVFFPTWGAANDIERGGMSARVKGWFKHVQGLTPERGLRAADSRGRVPAEVRECLAVAAEFKMVVCTGHISPAESIAVAQAAKDYGIDQVIFSHPDSHSVGARREHVRDMGQLNAICEFCALGMLPTFQLYPPRQVAEIVEELSAERTILTTDYFFEWAPPAAETLRMMIGSFLAIGMREQDVRMMVQDNPARLLGLDRLPCPHHDHGMAPPAR